ncbi:unnamed protein product, partial [Durusdinium trenchii]
MFGFLLWPMALPVAANCGSCQALEEWPKVTWALRVWSFWPGLAELEIRPQDVMPAAEHALAGALQPLMQYPSCQLAQLVLRLFLLCGMSAEDRLLALEESGTALLAEVAEVVQSCRVTGILESGWPLFSLLALLRRGLPEADRGGRLGRGAYDAWGKRVEAAWRSPAKVGPPPPEPELLGALPLRCSSTWLPGKRRPPRAPLAGAGMPAASAARAAALQARAQRQYLKYLDVVLRQLTSKTRPSRGPRQPGLLAFLSSTWPMCESMSLLEMAIFTQPMRNVVGPSPFRHSLQSTARLRDELRAVLEAQRPEAARRGFALRRLPGSVLPSEAFLLHCLADLQGVQVIVESGVGHGGSTRAACAWAKAVPGRRVLSLERALKDSVARDLAPACQGVLEMRAGDAFAALDWALHSAGALNVSVALLLDGPKGRVAVRMAEDAMQRFPGLRVAAIHDVPRLDLRYRDEDGR